jgi:hypothetical protein
MVYYDYSYRPWTTKVHYTTTKTTKVYIHYENVLNRVAATSAAASSSILYPKKTLPTTSSDGKSRQARRQTPVVRCSAAGRTEGRLSGSSWSEKMSTQIQRGLSEGGAWGGVGWRREGEGGRRPVWPVILSDRPASCQTWHPLPSPPVQCSPVQSPLFFPFSCFLFLGFCLFSTLPNTTGSRSACPKRQPFIKWVARESVRVYNMGYYWAVSKFIITYPRFASSVFRPPPPTSPFPWDLCPSFLCDKWPSFLNPPPVVSAFAATSQMPWALQLPW